MCYCDEDPELDEMLARLLDVACDVGIHGTRALGHCVHSRALLPESPVIAAIIREGIASLRRSCVAVRGINRTYDEKVFYP